jgi:hypothetical protein
MNNKIHAGGQEPQSAKIANAGYHIHYASVVDIESGSIPLLVETIEKLGGRILYQKVSLGFLKIVDESAQPQGCGRPDCQCAKKARGEC